MPQPACPRILIVDDEEDIQSLLADFLRQEGFDCVTAGGLRAALAALDRARFDIVLSDYNMPGGTGLELLHALQRRGADLAFVMATGTQEMRIAVDALTQGASDFLLKPLELPKVLASLRGALEKRRIEKERQRQLQQVEELLADAARESLQALALALDLRAGDMQGHSLRVSRYSVELARRLGYSEPALNQLEGGALVHDIGKMRIPDAVLLKPGPLTAEETTVMRTHVPLGHELVRTLPRLAPYAGLILAHHERFDGGGYPRGLSGEALPLDARVFAVADALDAMTSDRPYRKALDWEAARAEISRHSGTQFDPDVVRTFLAIPAARWQSIRGEVRAEGALGAAG